MSDEAIELAREVLAEHDKFRATQLHHQEMADYLDASRAARLARAVLSLAAERDQLQLLLENNAAMAKHCAEQATRAHSACDQLRAALLEACDGWLTLNYQHEDRDRIAELRKLAEGK